MNADEAFERCIRDLDGVLGLLSGPVTPSMVSGGWSDQKLLDLRSLVSRWRLDFEEDGEIRPRHHRIAIRWFLDAGVEFPDVENLMADVDNTVYEQLGLP